MDQLLKQPESKTLEFERGRSSPRNVLKTVVAFANSAGGRLLIGVDDARQVVGVADSLDAAERICSLIADGISPHLAPSVEPLGIDQHTVLVVEVFPSSARPHSLNSQGPAQGVYVRLGSSNRQAGPDWIAETRRAAADAHLPDAVEQIELFLKKHAFKTARFGAMRREDVWSISLAMLREAIVNALAHSDYAQRGTPIRVAFFDDRIDIESPGLLLPGMTIDDMKSGVSRIRNPVIARVFRELGLTGQWGRGIRRIFGEAARLGLPKPVITEIATGLRLGIYLGQHHAPVSPISGDHPVSDDEHADPSRLESRLAAKIALLLRRTNRRQSRTGQGPGPRHGIGRATQASSPPAGTRHHRNDPSRQTTSRLQKYRLTGRGGHMLKGTEN